MYLTNLWIPSLSKQPGRFNREVRCRRSSVGRRGRVAQSTVSPTVLTREVETYLQSSWHDQSRVLPAPLTPSHNVPPCCRVRYRLEVEVLLREKPPLQS